MSFYLSDIGLCFNDYAPDLVLNLIIYGHGTVNFLNVFFPVKNLPAGGVIRVSSTCNGDISIIRSHIDTDEKHTHFIEK